MKRNIIYLVGALLSSAILTFSCSDDDTPTYSDISVDKTDLFIKIENPTTEVNIISGNGNYRLTIADENIVTGRLEGNKIFFTGLKNGTTTATITDWTKHSNTINVRVKEDFELALDKNELTLIKDVKATEKVSIISGNGEYKVESSDETIATATLTENNKIEITAISNGLADITVTDADGKKVVLKVTAAEHEFKIGDIPEGTWGMREAKNIAILSGNGEYTTASDNEEIATAEIIDNNTIKVTGHKEGEATIIITDKMGFTQSFTINVEFKLISVTNIDVLEIDETVVLDILSGGSNYTFSITDGASGFSSNPKIECIISDDNKKLSIKGLSRGWNQVIKLTDNEVEQSVDITIQTVDVPFFTASKRYFINSWFANDMAIASHEAKDGKERVTMSNKRKIIGTPIDGWRISFTGGMNADVNPKENPVLAHIDGSGKEDRFITITNLRIVKAEDGWYWIKFREEGLNFDSYMVLKP